MSHVGRQQRQFRVDSGTHAIPAQQCIHGEAVSKVMDPWHLSFGVQDATLLKKRPQTQLQPRPIVCSSTLGGIPNESHIWRYRKPTLFSGTQIALDLIGDAGVDRKQAGLMELELSNQQSRVSAVVIAQSELEQFPAPDPSCEQENEPPATGSIACCLRDRV